MEGDYKKIKYLKRVLSAIPSGIMKTIKNKPWVDLIRYGVSNMNEVRCYSSKFINFHFLRLLNENKSLGDLSKSGMRKLFFAVCNGSKAKLNLDEKESKVQWEKLTTYKPTIKGLNTIATKTYETYYISFCNYHTYGLFQHYKSYLSRKYNISKKYAEVLGAIIFKELKIDLMPSLDEDSFKIVEAEIEKEVNTEKQNMKKWLEITKFTMECKIKLHYEILKWVETNELKVFSISPLCKYSLPYIELCKKAITDLQKFSNSKSCSLNFTDNELLEIAKPINCLHDVFNLKKVKSKLKQGKYALTMMTNGVVVYVLWGKDVYFNKEITKEEYDKRVKSNKKYEEEKKKKTDKQIKERGNADKRTTRKRAPKVLPPSNFRKINKTGLFDNKIKNGLYSKTALQRTKGNKLHPNTVIVSIDPGHKNIVTCSKTTLRDSNPELNYSLSLGEYYEQIGNKEYNSRNSEIKKKQGIERIEAELSKSTLKTSNINIFIENMKINLQHASKLLKFYGSNNQARRKFNIIQKTQRFYNKITSKIAPDPKTIIALGHAKFAISHKGLSNCPIARVVNYLSRERRVVIVPETNTTKMCSYCRHTDGITVSGISDKEKISKSGKKYRQRIHGLRHCKKCNQCLNRDANASRGIYFSFKNHYKNGCLPRFLRRKRIVCSGDVNVNNKKQKLNVHETTDESYKTQLSDSLKLMHS